MYNVKNLKKGVLAALMSAVVFNPLNVFAAEVEENAEPVAVEQEQAAEIQEQKETVEAVAVTEDEESEELYDKYNPRHVINRLNNQIADLQRQIEEQKDNQNRILDLIERLEKMEQERDEKYSRIIENENSNSPAVDLYGHLVNPGYDYDLSYTQDGANSQGNSTVIFRYAPNQLYKIYCRVGYLTDLSLKKGETISFVGGGDTSAWAVNSSTVDGVPHIYIKPTVETSNTNLIVTTNKRSYQLILNTSSWYNPMVTWTYGREEQAEALAQIQKDERTINGTFNGSYESLNFNYSYSGEEEYYPETVFDDGERTIIKFRKLPTRIPAVFIKEKGKKGISMVNFTTKNKSYILDRVANEINLRFDEDEVVKIKRNN